MYEESLPSSFSSASDRAVEQAIVTLKKGAHLLKYGSRGKPKFCPFRLSADERFLIWYPGQEEKQLRLSSVLNIIHGQSNKQPQLEKEVRCVSLIYANGKSSLELICKDKAQAECWYIGLKSIIHRNNIHEKKQFVTQSCINSPASFMRRKQLIFGLSDEKTTNRSSQVQSLLGSPTPSFSTKRSSGILKDVLIWGEGVLVGPHVLPRLPESTVMHDVRTISLGSKHAAIVNNHGEVFTWGEGKNGKLGHKIDSLGGVHVSSITCGENQTCAVTNSGEMYTWGEKNANLLSSHWVPRRVSGHLDGVFISSIACGEWHTAILSKSGRLFTCGDGTFGVLGHGDLLSYSRPKEIESLKRFRVKNVACGPWHTSAIVEIKINNGGKIFTWGDSDKGRLGHPGDDGKVLSPTYIACLLNQDFVQVSCGNSLTSGLTSNGRVYTIGSSVHGQLGNPQARDKSIVAVQIGLVDEFVVEISSGSHHMAVLTSDGKVYTWGKGKNGQLGLGDTKDRNEPTLVSTLKGVKVEKITCGPNSTAVICPHESFSSVDQLVCRGCGGAFGFTRKKHSCYNCGRVFCRSCSGKRSMNASLAPNETKAFRVCDRCFNQLQVQSVIDTPRFLTMRQKGNCDENEDAGPTSARIRSSEKKNVNVEGGKARWGRVECPGVFRKDDLGQSEKFIYEEIMNLKAQVDSLERLIETRDEKIQECRKKTEEAWSVAKEEAGKCKAAKELIQALTLKLYAMSENSSVLDVACVPFEDRDVENVCSSPVVYSNNLRSLNLRTGITSTEKESCTGKTGIKSSKFEWVEQYEGGVYITFTTLSDGKTGIRRVRFSRKKFDDDEAKRWWDENQRVVCQHYGVDGNFNLK